MPPKRRNNDSNTSSGTSKPAKKAKKDAGTSNSKEDQLIAGKNDSSGTSKSTKKDAGSSKRLIAVPCGDAFSLTAPAPSRNHLGQLVFEDVPDFRPNLSPKQVVQMGSFGGTYFRPIKSSVTGESYNQVWKELPDDWLKGLNVKTQIASSIYDTEVNKYKVKCGGSLDMWESSGWINKQDPYGWFMWYCRYYQGRRTEDDERQIGRWSRCAGLKGRWRQNLITKVYRAGASFDAAAVSPVVRQTLQHWGYELNKHDYDLGVKRVKK
ncbi:hypothetical protein GWK47_008278 [Chionoecetes opilio]|uniref:Uncharacterized protein n=1 Tax=Chionoecetes opilio TaxID=41210 RepID=A0A8J5CNP2_CHIOP|nr:hypothetical protein GWK47_008278 [Chionoecetes opilio]